MLTEAKFSPVEAMSQPFKVAGFDSLATFGSSEPVVTKVAAFESDLGPHVPGGRTTIPAERT